MTGAPELPDFALPDGHPSTLANRAPQRPAPLADLCDQAVALLGTSLPARVRVEHFPDDPDQYDFEGWDAAALVIYGGSRFSDEGLRGQQGAVETVSLIVTLLVRSLRGGPALSGAYELIHEIRAALHGQSLAGSSGLRPTDFELEDQAQGVFRYRLGFSGSVLALPTPRPAGIAVPRGFTDRR